MRLADAAIVRWALVFVPDRGRFVVAPTGEW